MAMNVTRITCGCHRSFGRKLNDIPATDPDMGQLCSRPLQCHSLVLDAALPVTISVP